MSPEFKLLPWMSNFFFFFRLANLLHRRYTFLQCWIILYLLEKGIVLTLGCWGCWLVYRKFIGGSHLRSHVDTKSQPNKQVRDCVLPHLWRFREEFSPELLWEFYIHFSWGGTCWLDMEFGVNVLEIFLRCPIPLVNEKSMLAPLPHTYPAQRDQRHI